MKKEVSFQRRLMVSVLCLTIPLILILLVSNIYSVQVFNSKIADSNMRSMDYRAEQIEENLEAANEFLMGIVAVSDDFRVLQGGANELNAHLSSYALYTQLKTAMPAYEDIGAFFIYSSVSRAERDMFSGDIPYEEKVQVRAFVRDAVQNNTYSYAMRWRLAEIAGENYLFRFYGGRGTYIVAMVPLDRLSAGSALDIEHEAVVLFADQENRPVTERVFIEETGIDLNGDYSEYFLSGTPEQYMILGRAIADTDCRMVLAVNEVGFLSSLNFLQITFLVISLLAVILIPVLQLRLTRSIAQPVEDLRGTMEQIRSGELDAKAQGETNIREFKQMNETFNTMMTQIKDLKIESYEHEIEKQKAELRYLQLQIRPHFFLNCLKSLYALAEAGKYDRIQKMILSFSKHIRYIFSDSMDFVPLSRELDHISNYIEMQAGSSQYPPVCRMDIDPRLLDLPIPPLSLQTFVENSVKHEYSPDHPLEIDVKASILRSGEDTFADLTVSDNGSGFPESVIQEINDPDRPLYTQNHVGINNIKKRMGLMYGDDVLYAFFNRDVGSVSEIFIPIDPEKYLGGEAAEE